MTKIFSLFKRRWLQLFLQITLLGVSVCILLVTLFSVYFNDRVFPNVWVSGQSVGGLRKSDAARELASAPLPENITLYAFVNGDKTDYFIPVSDIDLRYNTQKTVDNAFAIARNQKPLQNLKTLVFLLSGTKIDMPNEVDFDQEKLTDHLSVILGQVTTEPIYPSIKVVGGSVVVNPGKQGEEVSMPILRETITKRLFQKDYSPIAIPFEKTDYSLSSEQAETVRLRAENFLIKTIEIEIADNQITFSGDMLVGFIDPRGGYATEAISKKTQELQSQVNREPQNPVFVFEEGRVKEFAPAKNGIQLKNDEFVTLLLTKLPELEQGEIDDLSFAAPIIETKPATATGDINNLGITELVGKGTSRFRGSIAGRVYNVSLASSRIHGSLIPPGETFSFNAALGDVSKFTGYKEAYIIQDGKTVLGDGGGVCQVSTTLFRAVMNAGLPITERLGHSYRVGYYEQDSGPGLDATVYSPTTDFKFKNDTGHHILIQAIVDTKTMNLAFELYGTKDGRVATVSKPVILSSTAPPEDLYIDDPNLPAGTINQIEHKAWGAKVSFNYEVKREAEVVYKKTFVTNYKPWQAVYMRGTKPM